MKILVVDDDDDVRAALSRLLVRAGHQVVTASSGVDALERLRQPDAPAMALVDWTMPEMDGVELCRRVRAEATLSHLYVIMVTGKADSAGVVNALDAGADDVIGKPWTPEELLARVRTGARIAERAGGPGAAFQAALDEALGSPGGEVVVRAGEVIGRVFVHDGRIAWIDLPGDSDSLFALLHERTQMTTEVWQAIVEECRVRRTSLFDALIQWQVATPEIVAECARAVVKKRLGVLASLGGASAIFLPHNRRYATDLLFHLDEISDGHPRETIAPTTETKPATLSVMPGAPPPRDIAGVLEALMAIGGASAAAVIDLDSSQVTGSSLRPGSTEEATLRTQSRALRTLAADDGAEELIAAAEGKWHILVRRAPRQSTCLYVAVEQGPTSLGLARVRVRQIAEQWQAPSNE